MHFSLPKTALAAIAAATLSFSFAALTPAPASADTAAMAANQMSLAVADLLEAKRILGGDHGQDHPGQDPQQYRHTVVFDIDQAVSDIRGAAAGANVTLVDVTPETQTDDITVAHSVMRLLSKADKLVRAAGQYGTLVDAHNRIHIAYGLAKDARDARAW